MNVENLAKRWVEAQEGPAPLRAYGAANWEPIEKVIDLWDYPAAHSEQPEHLWELIKHVYLQKPKVETLHMLGTGPLEELVTYWGGEYIEHIKEFVNQHPDFKVVMQCVCFSSKQAEKYSHKDTHKQFYELAEIEPDFR